MSNNSELPKDYSEGRENFPKDQRREVVEEAINAAPNAFESPRPDAGGSSDSKGDATKGIGPGADNKTYRPLSDFKIDHYNTLGMSWDEIDRLRPPFIINQFIRWGEVMLLGAESKSGKSWLGQNAGFAVATGTNWLRNDDGRGGFETVQAKVYVIDLELSPSEIRFRFAKARGNRFADDPDAARIVTDNMHSYCFDGMNVADIVPRLAEIKELVKPGDLVILDCFYRLVPDANEAKDVAEMLELVKRFASDTQAGVIIVDHFRKAGDDKARNRFAGTYVKQASASTIVAIEVKDEVLTLNIDARTFHGCPKVFARFDLDSYTFVGIASEEMAAERQKHQQSMTELRLVELWSGRSSNDSVTAAEAATTWKQSRPAAVTRLGKLVDSGFLRIQTAEKGQKANRWILTAIGLLRVERTASQVAH